MITKVLSVAAGLLLNAFIVLLMEGLSHFLFPLPEELNTFAEVPEERIVELMASLSIGQYSFILGAWALGPFLGAALASKILPEYWKKSSFNIGVVVALSILWITYQMSYPGWLSLIGLMLPVPMAYYGGKLSSRP